MAKPDKKKTVEDDEEEKDKKPLTPEQQTEKFFTEHRNETYNHLEDITYTVSTGSLKLDIITGGGIRPGFTRLVGENSGGKTSEGLELMYNFLNDKSAKNPRRGVYVRAEGRFSQEIQFRSGLVVTAKPSEWKVGTCLDFQGNVYESVVEYMLSLILNNPTGCSYFFMVDSLDGLILRSDKETKDVQDAYKVAGPAVIGKKLMQRIALPLIKFGHIFVATSQVTAQPKIDPYAKTEYRSFASSGGNWAKHYADNIWEYRPRFEQHKILKNPKAKYDQKKNPMIGHLANLVIRKSNNEKNDVTMTYPIKHGQSGSHSIWVEREVGDILIAYQMQVGGSWLTFPESLHGELLKINADCPVKIQGSEQLYEFLEKNPLITEYLYNKFYATLASSPSSVSEGDPLEDDDEEEAAL